MFGINPDVFGKPGEGFHKARFLGMARNDLFGTLAIALIVAIVTGGNAFVIFAVLMAVAEIAHAVAGVDTAVIRAVKSLWN